MKTFYLIGTIAFSLIFFSCSKKKGITYREYKSDDESYSAEIPSNTTKGKSIADFMSFEDNHTHLLISIYRISEECISDYIHNKNITDNTFDYNLFQSSDTTSFYKVTKGNNMWAAYNLYMLKKMEKKNYLIAVNSDVLGQTEMIEMIKHIYSSMKPVVDTESADTITMPTQTDILEKSYTTKFYTIKYPKQWKDVIKQLNEMTDVYIGSKSDNFGFTIVRFETDYSLEEVKKEESANLRQVGIKVSNSKQVTVDGVKCYRAIHELNAQGQKIKQISYTFKKGDMVYNIKFGSVTEQAQETLAKKIVDSFRFK